MTKRQVQAMLAHVVVVAAALAFFGFHSVFVGQYELSDDYRLAWVGFYVAGLLVSAYALGLPDEAGDAARSRLGAAVVAVLVSAVLISLVQLALGSALLPRFVVFWTSLFAVVWYWLSATEFRQLRASGQGPRVLAIVSENEALALSRELGKSPEQDARLVGTMTPEALERNGAEALPSEAELVVLDRAAMASSAAVAWAGEQHARGARVRTLSAFYEDWLGKSPLSELERLSLMFDIGELHSVLYARQKRVFDVLVGVLLCALTLIACVPVAVLNFLANRGSLFYRQPRVGRGGKVFVIYKFRTMTSGGSSTWTTAADARVTPFGRLLRKLHIDELPQGLNLLKGDLSLIGPRPEQPHYVERLIEEIPFYDVRHLIRPGITGWAQVKFSYGASVADAKEKLQYDFFYLRRQGVALDLRIAARTLRIVTVTKSR